MTRTQQHSELQRQIWQIMNDVIAAEIQGSVA